MRVESKDRTEDNAMSDWQLPHVYRRLHLYPWYTGLW
jgi:hypothetical protein